MARPRVDPHRLKELIRLRRLGASGREVVRLLRMSPKTERRYRTLLAEAGILAGDPRDLPTLAAIRSAVDSALPVARGTPSSVEPWRPRVEVLRAKGLSAQAVFDRIRLDSEPGKGRYRGSYSAVKRFVRRLGGEQGRSSTDVALVIPTHPGAEAQVDFGYAGNLYDPARGVLRRAWVFVLLCTHSRHFFARVVFDQRAETWLRLHEEAFRSLGGVPATLVPDNTRRAVLRAAFGIDGETELERSYRELAEHYGFKIDPAPPGQPRKRGKVEATVKYLRNNPLKGRDGESIDDVQAALDLWNREVASVRVHGTTGLRPREVFEREERPALKPLPTAPWVPATWKQAKVHPDGHVTVRGRLFSAPWQLVHERLWVRACGPKVLMYRGERLVAAHVDRGARRTTLEEHLPEERAHLRQRSQAFWEQRARQIGSETTALVRAVFDHDEVLSHLRQVQAIVKHLEQFPAARAEVASARVRESSDLTYAAIKRTLAEGLDLVQSQATTSAPAAAPVCCGCGTLLRAAPSAALQPEGS